MGCPENEKTGEALKPPLSIFTQVQNIAENGALQGKTTQRGGSATKSSRWEIPNPKSQCEVPKGA
jgi:hypothetical protein